MAGRNITYQRPENALRRAEEFLGLGKEQKALVILYEIIRKRNQTWQKSHEEIIRKYLDLCIKFKNSNLAKDGLHQYKGLCQQVNAKSFQDILRGFLSSAEEKTETARSESHQALVDVDDLEAVNTAESLLLRAVSGEGAHDRADRSILLPWVKFLWESYRQCLELLRNNKNVEELYSYIALQGLKFCQKYERRAEFKKLCELFRNHLAWTIRMQQHSFSVQLKEAASFERHVEVRFAVLDVAIGMQLWQEAFRAIEDIFQVAAAAERPLLPSRQAQYFERAAHIFWQSQNFQYHALACQRLYQLTKEAKKTLTADELQMLASRVVCATLSVPILGQAHVLLDAVTEPDQRELLLEEKGRVVARLLWLPNMPSRAQLVYDLIRKQILQFAHPNLHPLFNCLEVEFDPYGIVPKMEKCLEFLQTSEQLKHYVRPLYEAAAVRCIQQLSQVYDNLSLDSVVSLLSFIDKFRLEYIVCNVAKMQNMKVSIDHQRSLVVFKPENGATLRGDFSSAIGGPLVPVADSSLAFSGSGDLLMHVAQVTSDSSRLLSGTKIDSDWMERMKYFATIYHQNASMDNAREEAIERRQLMNEQRLQVGEHRRAELAKQEEEAERRAREEAERRKANEEAARRLNEQRQLEKKLKMEQFKEIQKMVPGGGPVNEEGLEDLSTEDLMAKQIERAKQLLKERTKKLKQYEKKLDHLVRAKRIEEIPLLERAYDDFKQRDPREWEEAQAKLVAAKEAEAKYAIETKRRLSRMDEDCVAFISQVKTQRAPEYQRAYNAWERLMAEERSKRLAERKLTRKQDRRNEWRRQNAELQQKRREAEEKLREQEMEMEQNAMDQKPTTTRPIGGADGPSAGGYVPPHLRKQTVVQAPPPQIAAPPQRSLGAEGGSWRQQQQPAPQAAPPVSSGGAFVPRRVQESQQGQQTQQRPQQAAPPPPASSSDGLMSDRADSWRRGPPAPSGGRPPMSSGGQMSPSQPQRRPPPANQPPPQADSVSSWRK